MDRCERCTPAEPDGTFCAVCGSFLGWEQDEDAPPPVRPSSPVRSVPPSATPRRPDVPTTADRAPAAAPGRAALSMERGADYMLQGEITAIEDEEGREKVVYYQIDATLTDLESNIRVWAGQHKIKKYIERARIGW